MAPERDLEEHNCIPSANKAAAGETGKKEPPAEAKEVPKETKVKDTLVIMCSGTGATRKVFDFLHRDCGLAETDYDILAVPGGIHSVMLSAFLPKFKWAIQRALKFLVEEHHLKRVIAIDHKDCSWFKKLAISEPALIGARIVQHHAFTVALDCLSEQLPKGVVLEAWEIWHDSEEGEARFMKVK